jgi:uncharacterized RDD family membrane protein YckC
MMSPHQEPADIGMNALAAIAVSLILVAAWVGAVASVTMILLAI